MGGGVTGAANVRSVGAGLGSKVDPVGGGEFCGGS